MARLNGLEGAILRQRRGGELAKGREEKGKEEMSPTESEKSRPVWVYLLISNS